MVESKRGDRNVLLFPNDIISPVPVIILELWIYDYLQQQTTNAYRMTAQGLKHEDIMINLGRIEQVSFTSGTFFIADESGQYCGSKQGQELMPKRLIY